MAEEVDLKGLTKTIGGLPVAPPDPVGNLLWHSENTEDLIFKGDGILGTLLTGLKKE